MRTAFIETLCELAERDERIWLLCGDLGYSVLEVFAQRFPNRYVNVGVAEQNMTGIAAGLAMAGNQVITYSIANFPVLRCLEQIRNDVCYHNLNVKIVAVGGGLAYGSQGYTHHGVEDLAVTRVLPNMTVLAPGDPLETRLATQAMLQLSGPCYLRLGKAGETKIHTQPINFEIGKPIQLRAGNDAFIISTGGILDQALAAATALQQTAHLAVGVLSCPTVSPINWDALMQALHGCTHIFSLEEHGNGGLGAALLEANAQHGSPLRITPIAAQRVGSQAGSQKFLRDQLGLSIEHICAVVTQQLDHIAQSP